MELTNRLVVFRWVKRIAVWLLEMLVGTYLLGIVSFILLSVNPLNVLRGAFGGAATIGEFLFFTGYYLTMAFAGLFHRDNGKWHYPTVAGMLFLAHVSLVWMTKGGTFAPITLLLSGSSIVFLCAFAGSWLLSRWLAVSATPVESMRFLKKDRAVSRVKRFVLWFLEMLVGTYLVGIVFVLLLGADAFSAVRGGWFGATWVGVFLFYHGYYLTMAFAGLFYRSDGNVHYPIVAAMLFLVHTNLVYLNLGGNPAPVSCLISGSSLVFLCALLGNRLLKKWLGTPESWAGAPRLAPT